MYEIFSILANLFIFFFSETGRESKIANDKIEKDFCIFVNNQPDDWSDKLLMAEFAINNNESVFIKLSSFFASRDLHLYESFNIVKIFDIITFKQINK